MQLSNQEHWEESLIQKVLDCSFLDKPLLGGAFYFLRGFIYSGIGRQGITSPKTNKYFPSNTAAKILSKNVRGPAEASKGTDVS